MKWIWSDKKDSFSQNDWNGDSNRRDINKSN